MIFHILGCGTSTGVPIPGCRCQVCLSDNPRNKRSRTSALIKGESTNILIDAGTDLRWQALQWDVRQIDAVLFTHGHADHILGMDDLRGFNFVHKTPIPCYATKETYQKISQVFSYIINPCKHYEGGLVAQVAFSDLEHYVPVAICGISIHPFELQHGSTSVTGFRIGNLAYATDCNGIPPAAIQVLKGIKYLVLDGLRYKPHPTHFTIPEAIEAAREIGAETTYITHTTHSVDYDEVSSKLPGGIELAYDGLEIEFEP